LARSDGRHRRVPPAGVGGVYGNGKVSFSMTGAWETRVTVNRGGATLVSTPAQPVVFLTNF
jgi:hypothetical protein